MAILVTGGAGYIGSHTVVELLNANKEVVVLDNLCNSSPKSLERVKKITGKDVKFYEGDILDRALLQKIFAENSIQSVIHFAGLKAVGESVQKPAEYYMNNVRSHVPLQWMPVFSKVLFRILFHDIPALQTSPPNKGLPVQER